MKGIPKFPGFINTDIKPPVTINTPIAQILVRLMLGLLHHSLQIAFTPVALFFIIPTRFKDFNLMHFVTTHSHRYTLVNLVARREFRHCHLWSYENLFLKRSVPSGVWIFTDHERLSAAELETAGKLATKLQNGGAQVLNHPALVKSRFEILRLLQQEGINSFAAFRAESDPRPAQFPVFIRNEYDHRAKELKLIYSQKELNRAQQEKELSGSPLRGKLVIEYVDAEIMPNVWQRASAYYIAGKIIKHHMAFDDSWVVKDGFSNESIQKHHDRDAILEMEREFITGNRYDEVLAKVFSLARIEYGRADFSINNDKLEIFEINTNPNQGNGITVPCSFLPEKSALRKQSEDSLLDSFRQIDHTSSGKIRLKKRIKYHLKYGPRFLWRP